MPGGDANVEVFSSHWRLRRSGGVPGQLYPGSNAGSHSRMAQICRGPREIIRSTWQDLPTMHHGVNALAEFPILEIRGGSISRTRGGKASRSAHPEMSGLRRTAVASLGVV